VNGGPLARCRRETRTASGAERREMLQRGPAMDCAAQRAAFSCTTSSDAPSAERKEAAERVDWLPAHEAGEAEGKGCEGGAVTFADVTFVPLVLFVMLLLFGNG